jgi:SAM-dependent methyltransferase
MIRGSPPIPNTPAQRRRMAYISLDHVQLAMPRHQEDRARSFYRDVLALTEIPKPETMRASGGAWFRSGGVEIHLGVDTEFTPARKAHPGIRVDDIEAIAARCAAASRAVAWDERYPGVRRFYVDDPFGNRLEILQETLPRMYVELAPWWPLISAPEDYAEEADFYEKMLREASSRPPRTVLELGSGGGNNASHLKRSFEMVLVDLSPPMIEVSRSLNPECEHLVGDLRSVRLEREFDCVFVHDAIAYMVTEEDLRQAITTAFLHCRPGGVALFAPDHVKDTFRPSTDSGGHDGDDASLRYLEWTWDPDPSDSTILVDYTYVLRSADGSVRTMHDRHLEGVFARADWLRLLGEAGFEPWTAPFDHSEVDRTLELVLGRRPVA